MLVGGCGPRWGGGRLFWEEGAGYGGFGRRLCGAAVAAALRETACVPVACFFVGGNRLRRGGELLFRGGAGFGHVTRRFLYSPSLFAPSIRFHYSPSLFAATARCLCSRSSPPASPLSIAFPCLSSSAVACTPAACRPLPPPLSASPLLPAVPPLLTSRTSCLSFPPPCAGRADGWAAAAPRVVGRDVMRCRREVLRNNLENRKILPIFVSVKYRGSGLSRPGFLFFIGLSFIWQKRLSI